MRPPRHTDPAVQHDGSDPRDDVVVCDCATSDGRLARTHRALRIAKLLATTAATLLAVARTLGFL